MIAVDSPEFKAMLDMLGRTGAKQVQLRYSDDEKPTVWFVVVVYADGRAETGAALDLGTALERCCEQMLDGGECTHCHRPTGFDLDFTTTLDMLTVGSVCWYQYDPELATIRRGCES